MYIYQHFEVSQLVPPWDDLPDQEGLALALQSATTEPKIEHSGARITAQILRAELRTEAINGGVLC